MSIILQVHPMTRNPWSQVSRGCDMPMMEPCSRTKLVPAYLTVKEPKMRGKDQSSTMLSED